MQLIKPSQISGEIMTLIEEADKKVILVSPYFRVSKWYKFLNRLDAAKRRNLEVEIYVREGEYESIDEVLETGFHPITVPNLHTKLYINEKQAIVSSMNLLLSSDTSSLDIALKTENTKEHNELLEYYTRYIKNAVPASTLTFNSKYNWRDELDKGLLQVLGKEAYITELEGKLQIQTSNKYEAFIANNRTNDLRIFGILSGKEFDFATNNQNIFQASNMVIELQEGRRGYYDTVWGTIKGLKSYNINELKNEDQALVIDAIIKFITGIEQLKKMVR